MRLTIVTKAYPPDIVVSARRWGGLVPPLQDAGVTCTVITAGDGGFARTIGKAGEVIIRLPISTRDATRRDEGERKSPVKWRAVLKSAKPIIPPVLREMNVREWLREGVRKGKLLDIARSSDFIISSYGPLGPLMLGWFLAVSARRPWVADIRDSFEIKDGAVSALARSVSRHMEGCLLRRAIMRTTVGDTLAAHLGEKYGVTFHSIYNGWTDADRVRCSPVHIHGDSYLYYAGSIYSHQLPALEVLLEGMQVAGVPLKVRLLRDYTNGLFLNRVNPHVASGRVEILPPVDKDVVNAELRGALAAIVLEDLDGADAVRRGTVTGKLFGLLASGVPGLAISSPKGEIRRLVSLVYGWYGVASVGEVAGALREITQARGGIVRADTVRQFHVAQQARKLLGLLSRLQQERG